MRRSTLLVCAMLCACLLVGLAPDLPAQAQDTPPAIYLPLVSNISAPATPFGFVLGAPATAQALDLGAAAARGLTRLGDANWALLEPVQGAPYRWEQLAELEQRIAAVRARGMEPLVTIQWSPAWARVYPQSPCGPIKPEAYAAFARFSQALVERYRAGPLLVRYWEIWNEPDFFRNDVEANGGYGCWAEPGQPYSGGDRFGALLKAVYPAIKQADPSAVVISGSVTHIYAGAQYNDFLEGMLASGAGDAFDMLGFHAYGDWRAEDLLVRKVAFARAALARYQLASKPLLLTEIAALCLNDRSCATEPTAELRARQAGQTARLNAEVLALRIPGVLWYPLISPPPGFAQSQLLSYVNNQIQVNPAYFALRSSASLLNNATATETQPRELTHAEQGTVQFLRFNKPGSTLYVLWVQQTSQPVPFTLLTLPGARATCYEQFEQPTPLTTDCSDADRNGTIERLVNESPTYIEVRP